MTESPSADSVTAALAEINRAWREGRPRDLAPLLHPSIVMAFPGWSGRVAGKEAFITGFVDFCENAKVHEYRESDHQIDVTGDTAVAAFAFEMVYERSGSRYRSTGRDLWIFARQGGQWLPVWRTMLDVAEQPA